MNIKKTFLNLTRKTYPYGFEDQLKKYLPSGHFNDAHGNYFYKIGNSKTAFACHLDTACKTQVNVVHKFEKNIISTDGRSILGADDKAGMTVLLFMIYKRVPGLYCFFIGEEVGCIGSSKASCDPEFLEYDRMVSFDRRGTNSIITFQQHKRCCSDDFANALSKEYNKYSLNMSPDSTGVYTDSAEFTGLIPECTNISVGYYREHTHSEHQDIEHLIKICLASTKINWDNLPVVRNPKEVEDKPYFQGSYSSRGFSSYNLDNGKYKSKYSRYTEYDSRWGDWYGDTPINNSWKNKSKYGNYHGYSNCIEDDYNNYPPRKSYFNDLENEIEIRNYGDENYYESLKQELYNDEFTNDEIEKLCDQYFDLPRL
jgi:hypothetical protein